MFHIEDALSDTCPHCGESMMPENTMMMGYTCPRCKEELDFGKAIHELRTRIKALENTVNLLSGGVATP